MIKVILLFVLTFGLQVTAMHGLNLEDEVTKYLAGEIKFEINDMVSDLQGCRSTKLLNSVDTSLLS